MVEVCAYSLSSKVVIRYPEIIKKILTPRFANAPPTSDWQCRDVQCPITTIKIEMARNPSSDGIWRMRPQHKQRTRFRSVTPNPNRPFFPPPVPTWELQPQHQNCPPAARPNASKSSSFVL